MSDAFLLFVATFGVVFALGLQSLNVNGGHRAMAFATSFVIGGANLVLFKVLPGPTGALEIAAYLLGGPFGILASMAAHPWLVRLLRSDWLHLRWRLRVCSPREGEERVAAAFAEPLTPSREAAAAARPWLDTEADPVDPVDLAGASGAGFAEAIGQPADAWAPMVWLHRDDAVTAALTSAEHAALRQLADDLLNPEELGHAVPPEVRDRARAARGMTHREVKPQSLDVACEPERRERAGATL
jgi:hypothetical protein